MQGAGEKLQPEYQCESLGCYHNETAGSAGCYDAASSATVCDDYKGDLPLHTFFNPTGILIFVFMAAIFLGVFYMIWKAATGA